MTQDTVSSDEPTPSKSSRWAAWSWIPTLYFAEGLPLIVVMSVSTVMFKELGISNAEITLYTSLLYLPWTIKPLWSPLVDLYGTQRLWIIATQVLITAALFGVAMMAPTMDFFTTTLTFFWIMAIGSATHDIAADGFYMTSMPQKDQAWFIGIRSSFYRLAVIAGSGILVMLAGHLGEEKVDGTFWMTKGDAWSWAFLVAAGLYGLFAIYHFFVLPRPATPERTSDRSLRRVGADFAEVFASFFRKKHVWWAVAYILLYRFSEAQLAKMKAPFLMDKLEEGGLGLTTIKLGWLDGTIGVSLLTLGGIIGGMILARDGLRRWIFPMALAINLPNAAYAYLAFAQPTSEWAIGAVIAIEQVGYGLGFAGFMLYMLYFSRGEHQTAHYAICTGFMALGMMIPGMFSGFIQEGLGEEFIANYAMLQNNLPEVVLEFLKHGLGYDWFFVWVTAAMIPSLIITLLLPMPSEENSA